jgi:hypothetical protein
MGGWGGLVAFAVRATRTESSTVAVRLSPRSTAAAIDAAVASAVPAIARDSEVV